MFGAWLGREYSPGSAYRKNFRRPARYGSVFREAGQVLRMNVNGRLTAPPRHEVELVTNSVCAILPEGVGKKPEAGGTPLESFSLFTRLEMRDSRMPGFSRFGGGLQWKVEPVSATQALFVSEGAALGS